MAIKLTAYEGVKIQQNHYIEYIDIYLLDHESTTLKETTILSKDFDSDEDAFTIKITNKGDSSDILNVNYIKLVDIDTRYYFVTGAKRLSNDIWQLSLVLDVVNTYRDDILFVNNLKQVSIKRRHKDRWKLNNTTKNYERVFDKVDEGFDELATQMEVAREVNSEDFYLVTKEIPSVESQDFWNFSGKLFSQIYCNESNQGEYNIINYYLNPANSDLCIPDIATVNNVFVCDKPILCTTSGTTNHIADLFVLSMNSYTTTGTRQFTASLYSFKRTANGKYTCVDARRAIIFGASPSTKSFHIEGLADNLTWYYNTAFEPTIDSKEYSLDDLVGSSATKYACSTYEVTTTLVPITSIDTADSSIKTIINIPVDVQNSNLVWFKDSACCVFNDLISNTKNLDISTDNVLSKINKVVRERNINYESKLYGSYVRKHYIAYDAFKLPAMPEYLNDLSNLKITTYIPNDMTTNIMIMSDTIIETGYKSNVLMCSRNNNLSVFSDSYLDYIRNGYNYDQKNQAMSNISNWVNFGSSIVGTGIGISKAKGNAFMASNVLSMGINTVTSLGSSIMSSIQNERALLNKRNQILNSSVSMSGSDNVLLFKETNYGYNLIQYVVEAPNSELLNSIWNLFYFTGYADNLYYEVMPKIKTRTYFNYIQADIYQCSITNAKIRNRIVAAYGAGITFEWQYNNTWLCEGTLYENWEKSI